MRKYNPTPEQKAKSEERRAKMRQLAKIVSEMSAEERMAIVERLGAVITCESRALSLYNTCFLFAQFEGVSIVGGFQQWRAAGRQVRKGEHGLAIWIPTGKKSESASDAPAAGDEERPNFFLGNVFDVTQTDPIAAE